MSDRSNIFWFFLVGVAFIAFTTQSGIVHIPTNEVEKDGHPIDENGEVHGVVETFEEGRIRTAVRYEHGIKDGVSYIYYKNGNVLLEMPYESGKREGKSIKYYQDGKVYAITPYVDDELTGIRKTYYANGNLKGEIPYYRGHHGVGLKEYLKNGSVNPLPKIRIEEIAVDGIPHLSLTVPGCDDVNFYIGSLFNNKYLIPDVEYMTALPIIDNESVISLEKRKPPLNIICDCMTPSVHPFVDRVVYNP